MHCWVDSSESFPKVRAIVISIYADPINIHSVSTSHLHTEDDEYELTFRLLVQDL
jgi:hypothetical protein